MWIGLTGYYVDTIYEAENKNIGTKNFSSITGSDPDVCHELRLVISLIYL